MSDINLSFKGLGKIWITVHVKGQTHYPIIHSGLVDVYFNNILA